MEELTRGVSATRASLWQYTHQRKVGPDNRPSKLKHWNRRLHIASQQNPGRKTNTNPILLLGTRPRAAMSGSNMRNKRACSQAKNPPPCTNIGNGQHRIRHDITCRSIDPNAGCPQQTPAMHNTTAEFRDRHGLRRSRVYKDTASSVAAAGIKRASCANRP